MCLRQKEALRLGGGSFISKTPGDRGLGCTRPLADTLNATSAQSSSRHAVPFPEGKPIQVSRETWARQDAHSPKSWEGLALVAFS